MKCIKEIAAMKRIELESSNEEQMENILFSEFGT
jgi:hypothetical protein